MIDHLLWGVPDLEAGRRDVAARLGVEPAPGGRHPEAGTRNALMGLGDERYFEVLAPDPEGSGLAGFGLHLAGLTEPGLLTWCARGHDLEATARAADAAGLEPGAITPMSRRRPDGHLLEWRLLFLGGHELGPLVPFFIDWGTTSHPARDAPAGCRLAGFCLEHPDPGPLRRLLAVLRAAAEVRPGPTSRLVAEIDGPRGRVRLTGPPPVL